MYFFASVGTQCQSVMINTFDNTQRLLMTPLSLPAMRCISSGFEGCLFLMSTAVDSTTVEIAVSPAARMVSPDSRMH